MYELHVVPQERISIVKPQRGNMQLPTKGSTVNPNGVKQRGIPENEYPGISNPKEDPIWR